MRGRTPLSVEELKKKRRPQGRRSFIQSIGSIGSLGSIGSIASIGSTPASPRRSIATPYLNASNSLPRSAAPILSFMTSSVPS